MADQVALDAEKIGEPLRCHLTAVSPAGARLAAHAQLLLERSTRRLWRRSAATVARPIAPNFAPSIAPRLALPFALRLAPLATVGVGVAGVARESTRARR